MLRPDNLWTTLCDRRATGVVTMTSLSFEDVFLSRFFETFLLFNSFCRVRFFFTSSTSSRSSTLSSIGVPTTTPLTTSLFAVVTVAVVVDVAAAAFVLSLVVRLGGDAVGHRTT